MLTAIFGGIAVLILFAWLETKVEQPMFRLNLFRIRAFTAGTSPACSVPSAAAASSSC